MTHRDRAVGIDLGTTNSEIALLTPSERDILVYEDRFARRTVPSAVAWDPAGERFLVGRDARARRGRQPPPVESVKRKMGQDTKLACGPHELSPEELSAKILGELRERMQAFLDERPDGGPRLLVERAVVTVPAYFDAPQVEATRRAAELAGLDPIGILQEPTAAAVYQTWKRKLGDGHYLVYDLGGGTFDVSVLRCLGGEYQVVAIDGDNYLGGDDLDRRFAEQLRKELCGRGYALELDVRGDAEDRLRFAALVHLAQEIKEALSTREVLSVSRQAVCSDRRGESVDYEGEIGRADYEAAVGDLVESTITCCRRALEQSHERAAIGAGDIDRVILVGGSTRVPLVERRVREALCAQSMAAEPLADEVDTCVALGAAVYAAQLGGLRLADPQAGARVILASPLVAQKSPLRLSVRVEDSPAGSREIAVVAGGEQRAAAPLQDEVVVQMAVPLGDEPEQDFTLAFVGESPTPLAELPFRLWRGDVRPRPSALSRAAIVAKDIALEVVRAGRRERCVLLPRGTALPMKVSHTFFTADRSGAVVLRLLQGQLPIKTLMLEIPGDTAVGTPVALTLRCDEAMRIEARAEVAGHDLWARLEPPPAPRLDAQDDVEALLGEADTVGRALWGDRAVVYRREVGLLGAAIRELVTVDPDKLSVLASRLRAWMDEYRGDDTAGGLAPPLAHFEFELDRLRRTVYRQGTTLMGLERDAWEARIADLDGRGREAYDAVDAGGWRRVNNELQALRETAAEEEARTRKRLEGSAWLANRLEWARRRAQDVARELADFVPSAEPDVRRRQLAERDALARALAKDVNARIEPLAPEDESTAAEARRALELAHAELDRIEVAVERIPSLGVVAEHGGGPPSR